MQWIRFHPYASTLCAVGLVIVTGVFFIQRQNTEPAPNTTSWSGTNIGILNPAPHLPTQNATETNPLAVIANMGTDVPYKYILPPAESSPDPPSDVFDLSAFVQTLSQNLTQRAGAPVDNSSFMDAYAFIPSSLIATTQRPAMTAAQKALYDYGNEIGSSIQSYEKQNPAAVSILKDHIEDRTNPQKVAGVNTLARNLAEVGHILLRMPTVPGEVASAHSALAKSYIAIGTNLALAGTAASDADFLHAIEVYNASADILIKNYVAMATLFGAYDVSFTQGDAGSAFTFATGGF